MAHNLYPDSYPLQPYMGSDVPPPSGRMKWISTDNAEAYAQYLSQTASQLIPEEYRLDDDWEYVYNRFGYRGEEYNPNAKRHIAVCGCSYTYGVGIKWEQTFAYQFKYRFAKHNSLVPQEVNLLNFAQSGASNDYICRTLFTQLNTLRPDLVLVYFTHPGRKEFVDEQRIESMGPWQLEWDEPYEPSLYYYAYHTDEIGFINTVRNILLVQYFLKARQVPYIFAWSDSHNLADPRFIKNPVCKSYVDQIDRPQLADFKLQYKDLARDNDHPGPQSHEVFGQHLFDLYLQVYSPNPTALNFEK